MRTYFKHLAGRFGSFHYGARTFECYKSRPDGEGWDYNCDYSRYGSADAYVDVGAGRRPFRASR